MGLDTKAIQELRASTGAGIMAAKKALEEANGDAAKAAEILRKKGIAKAADKAGRETKAGLVDGYIHMGRVGAIVEVNCETDFVARTDDFKTLVHDIAMQVAASNPQYLAAEDVPKEVISKEKRLLAEADEVKGKPKDVTDKIVAGKLEKYLSEVCLHNQAFIKDPDKTVAEVVAEAVAKLGENIQIARFTRFELGG